MFDLFKNTGPDTKEHKTHISALVFLVFLSLALVMLVLSVAAPEPPITNDNLTTQERPANQRLATFAEAKDSNRLPRLITSLPLSDSAVVRQNFSHDLPGDQTQQVSVFEFTNQSSLAELTAEMNTWLQNNDYTVNESSQANGSAVIIAETGTAQVILSLTQSRQDARLEVNLIRF